jgi:hypothetical protein
MGSAETPANTVQHSKDFIFHINFPSPFHGPILYIHLKTWRLPASVSVCLSRTTHTQKHIEKISRHAETVAAGTPFVIALSTNAPVACIFSSSVRLSASPISESTRRRFLKFDIRGLHWMSVPKFGFYSYGSKLTLLNNDGQLEIH